MNTQPNHTELLQAFLNFKPGRRGSSKSSQSPSTSIGSNSRQTPKATPDTTQHKAPDSAATTSETAGRKRTGQSHHKEGEQAGASQTYESSDSDSDTPMIQTHKRPCHSQSMSSAKGQTVSIVKPDKSPQKQTVEVQVPARVEKCLDSPFSASRSSRESGMEAQPQALKDGLASLQGSNGGTFGHATVPTLSEAPNATELATKILNENSNFRDTLAARNDSFMRTIPVHAAADLQEKLAKITADLTRLHQEKVDAIKLEYVARLQRAMEEQQKLIDMLMQPRNA